MLFHSFFVWLIIWYTKFELLVVQEPSSRQTQGFQKMFNTETKQNKRKEGKKGKPRGVSDRKRGAGKEELLPSFLDTFPFFPINVKIGQKNRLKLNFKELLANRGEI